MLRVKSELEEERRVRYDGHEAILGIMEEAAGKVEKA